LQDGTLPIPLSIIHLRKAISRRIIESKAGEPKRENQCGELLRSRISGRSGPFAEERSRNRPPSFRQFRLESLHSSTATLSPPLPSDLYTSPPLSLPFLRPKPAARLHLSSRPRFLYPSHNSSTSFWTGSPSSPPNPTTLVFPPSRLTRRHRLSTSTPLHKATKSRSSPTSTILSGTDLFQDSNRCLCPITHVNLVREHSSGGRTTRFAPTNGSPR